MHTDAWWKMYLYRFLMIIPDSIYVRLKYRKAFGRWPNLKHPQTFNEKLNWLKLHDRNPLYTTMVDKYEAKRYVADLIGEEYIIPTLGVWERAEDIDFDSLPDKFVLKATHDSGRVIICRDKSKLDKAKAVKEMRESLKRNFYAVTREWPYKNVKPRIIAEQLLENSTDTGMADYKVHNQDINDYKFFCFNGHVEFMKVDFDRHTDHHANYYDRDFNLLDFGENVCPPIKERIIQRPILFSKMIELSEKISKHIRFVRVDFYEVNNRIYFGEITFFPDSGIGMLSPKLADFEIGKLLNI